MYANTAEPLEIPLTSEVSSGAASSTRDLRPTSGFESGRLGAISVPSEDSRLKWEHFQWLIHTMTLFGSSSMGSFETIQIPIR